MKRPSLKSHQLAVRRFKVTKHDYQTIDPDERVLFFMLAQTSNEIGMLHAILMQALNGVRDHHPRPVRETSLGMALFMARLMTNRLCEGWTVISKVKTVKLFDQLWTDVPPNPANREIYGQAIEARDRLSVYFGQSDNLLTKVRNKLASHIDRATFSGAFDIAPTDLDMSDFHTGLVGTTFFGGADSLQAIAVSHLIGSQDSAEGNNQLLAQVSAIAEDLKTFIDGFSVAFIVSRFGASGLGGDPQILSNLPKARHSRVHYFMS